MDDPRYPVGRFSPPEAITPQVRAAWIKDLAECPANLRKAIEGLTSEQLDTPYREGGWTVRQVAQHLPDAHVNPFVRFQQALTVDSPAVNNFYEDRWLPYQKNVPLEAALQLFDALHARWVLLCDTLSEADWKRTFVHSEMGPQVLDATLGRYAWHGRHHVAQITRLRQRMGW